MQPSWCIFATTVALFLSPVNCSDLEYPQMDETCTSHLKTEGKCTVVEECNEIFMKFISATKNILFLDLVRRSQCGFDGFRPKVQDFCMVDVMDDILPKLFDYTGLTRCE
ncbi:uncharacterized protein LOC143921657 [Arctopsyche grandis]|uniref:uncharacterized protein LOC143921657 n=1 Tax=Arctopsyche grandis TaxID=121162 RepID=UPI00406D811C